MSTPSLFGLYRRPDTGTCYLLIGLDSLNKIAWLYNSKSSPEVFGVSALALENHHEYLGSLQPALDKLLSELEQRTDQ